MRKDSRLANEARETHQNKTNEIETHTYKRKNDINKTNGTEWN